MGNIKYHHCRSPDLFVHRQRNRQTERRTDIMNPVFIAGRDTIIQAFYYWVFAQKIKSLTKATGMLLRSNCRITEKPVLVLSLNFHGRSRAALQVYLTYPLRPSNEHGSSGCSCRVNGYWLTPCGITELSSPVRFRSSVNNHASLEIY